MTTYVYEPTAEDLVLRPEDMLLGESDGEPELENMDLPGISEVPSELEMRAPVSLIQNNDSAELLDTSESRGSSLTKGGEVQSSIPTINAPVSADGNVLKDKRLCRRHSVQVGVISRMMLLRSSQLKVSEYNGPVEFYNNQVEADQSQGGDQQVGI